MEIINAGDLLLPPRGVGKGWEPKTARNPKGGCLPGLNDRKNPSVRSAAFPDHVRDMRLEKACRAEYRERNARNVKAFLALNTHRELCE
ncbi:hypothetical protein NDU88_007730 [Pleurodeles waltl]|uniref:Uncharacterized protein n=1 Tax=Pleurodeles waltl TaxID=8319 RepID=A0AAV7ST71_PLEWA|nr:hypothetical protein NDU88_007730 [Pleurodeles waltl]